MSLFLLDLYGGNMLAIIFPEQNPDKANECWVTNFVEREPSDWCNIQVTFIDKPNSKMNQFVFAYYCTHGKKS